MGRRAKITPGQTINNLQVINMTGTGTTAKILCRCVECRALYRLSRQTFSYANKGCPACRVAEAMHVALLNKQVNGVYVLTTPKPDSPQEFKFLLAFRPFNSEGVADFVPEYSFKKIGKHYGFVEGAITPVENELPVPDEGYAAAIPLPLAYALYLLDQGAPLPQADQEEVGKICEEWVDFGDDMPQFFRGSGTTWVQPKGQYTYVYVRSTTAKQKKPPRPIDEAL